MYKLIWNKVNTLNVDRKTKHRIYIAANTVLYTLLGLIVWFIIDEFITKNVHEWFACFVGYPSVLLGLCGSIFTLFKYDQ